MVRYVYVDVLFAINLLVNYLLLLAAGKVCRREVRPAKLVAASAAGGLYAAVSVFFPYSAAFSLPARLAFGLFMVAIAYDLGSPQAFAIASLSFFLCSALAAGIAMGLENAKVASSVQGTGLATQGGEVPWWILAISLAALGALPAVTKIGGFQPGKPLPLLKVELRVGGRRLTLTGMVDTGNNLRDPVSGLPVVVVDWAALQGVMPGEMSAFFQSTWDLMPPDLYKTPMGKKLRLIPYENVSGRRGVLPGFRPDSLVIVEKGGRLVAKEVVVGVFRERLSPTGLFQALLHPDLVTS